MIAAGSHVEGAKVDVLGLPFKENCSDLRNSKVIDIIRELRSYGADLYVTDPRLGAEEAMHEYCVKVLAGDEPPRADAMVSAVAHREFAALGQEDVMRKLVKGSGPFIDVKYSFGAKALRAAGFRVWRP